jgi:hypothetical protein
LRHTPQKAAFLRRVLLPQAVDRIAKWKNPCRERQAHGAGVALVPKYASRFQRPGVLFKPLAYDLLCIEAALFVRRDQMR